MRGLTGVACLLVATAGCSPDPISIGDNGLTAAHCRDGKIGKDESDVDCGGKDCLRCVDGKKCSAGADCASGSCVNGVCEKACNGACNFANATGKCANGACVLVSCNAGFGDCDGNSANGCELDLTRDGLNCGACGAACGLLQTCEAGVCKNGCKQVCDYANGVGQCVNGACQLVSCNNGWGDCDRDPKNGCELDLTADDANCGACGTACDKDSFCSAGTCQPSNFCDPAACMPQNGKGECVRFVCILQSCDAGYADCNALIGDGCEIHTASDPNNCGTGGLGGPGCGVVCSNNHMAARTCGQGVCNGTCANGYGDCDGNLQTNGCEIALATDVLNCGACGVGCGKGQVCVAGQCQFQNCVCNPANAKGQCQQGVCVILACNQGFGDCNASAVDGCEVNLTSDAANCGACGSVCGNLKRCLQGVCQ